MILKSYNFPAITLYCDFVFLLFIFLEELMAEKILIFGKDT